MANEMITWDNYEEYLILHADGELDEAGEAALQRFIAQHPEAVAELEGYEAVHFQPDMSVTYAGKADLLKPIPAGRTITLGSWQRYAAAAGIILALVLGSRWILSDRTNDAEETRPVAVATAPQVKTQDIATAPTPNPVAPAHEPATAPVTPPANPAAFAHTTTTHPKAARIDGTVPRVLPELSHDAMQQIQTPAAGAPDEQRPLLAAHKLTQPQPVITIANPAEAAEPSSLIARLPISEERREGLEGLKEAVTEKLAKARHIRNDLKDAQFALKFGNKELRVF